MPQVKIKIKTTNIFLSVVLVMIVLLLSNCGGSSDSGTTYVQEEGHTAQWIDPSYDGTEEFHGSKILVSEGTTQGSQSSLGETLYKEFCSACHGEDASGVIGPNIQGKTAEDITNAISTVSLMKGLTSISENDKKEIAEFLAAAGSTVTSTVQVNTDECIKCHGEDLDGGIANISCYSCHNGPTGTIGHQEGWRTNIEDPVHFHGKYGKPFAIACTACHGSDLRGKLGPSCFDCHNGTEWDSF